jgi:outer membrane protein assembly factor BamB
MQTVVLAMMVMWTCRSVFAADWLAEGYDPQRSAWQRDESILNAANVHDMKLLWKTKLDTVPREMHNLFPPLILGGVKTAHGLEAIAIVASVSDDLFGVDAATGQVLWRIQFENTYKKAASEATSTLCPGGQTASPVATAGSHPGSYVVYAVSWDGRLHTVNGADGKELVEPRLFVRPNGKPYALNLFNDLIYASTAQTCGGNPDLVYAYDLHTERVSVFSPAGGGMWARRGVAVSPDGTVYIGTGDGAFDQQNGVLGNSLVAIKPNTRTDELHLVGFYTPINAAWMYRRDLDVNVSPLSFDYQGRHFLIATSKECRLWLLDRDDLGGDDHRTALYRSPRLCNDDLNFAAAGVWGGMASYQDSQGAQWVLVPYWGPVSANFHAPIEYGRTTQGGVAAFKVENREGRWQLTPAWLSANMNMGEEALVANGIVFAYGSGEETRQYLEELAWNEPPRKLPTDLGDGLGTPTRIALSTHATLYALDAQTGAELWSSDDQITSWSHFSGISEANGRVYIPTFDGYLYCFGTAKSR